MRTDAEFLLNRELEDHQILFAQLEEIAGGDEDALRDFIEGETNVLELIEKLDAHIVEAEIEATGAAAQIDKLTKRKRAAENRIERFRDAIKSALEIAKLKSHKTTISTLSLKPAPIKAIVLNEADVPSKWFKPADPKIDQGGLTTYFRDAKKAADAAAKIKDEAERAAALAKVDEDFPPIPGVSVSAGATTLSRS